MVNDSGTVASVTNGRDYTTSFTYDALNRLTGITYPNEPGTDPRDPVTVVWDTPNNTRTLTRGDYQQIDTFDGFARFIHT